MGSDERWSRDDVILVAALRQTFQLYTGQGTRITRTWLEIEMDEHVALATKDKNFVFLEGVREDGIHGVETSLVERRPLSRDVLGPVDDVFISFS